MVGFANERSGFMLAASFGTMLVFYAVEFVAIVSVAVLGLFVGKALRQRKEKKKVEKV